MNVSIIVSIIVIVLVIWLYMCYPDNEPIERMIKSPSQLPYKKISDKVEIYNVFGNIGKSGRFITLVKSSPGTIKKPHTHPTDVYVVMISGEHYVAYGKIFDKSKGTLLVPGSVQINPKGVPHYEWTPTGSTLLISSTNPWETNYI